MKAQSLRRTLWLGSGLLGLGLAGAVAWLFLKVRPAQAEPMKDVQRWAPKAMADYKAEPIAPQTFYPVDEKDLEEIVQEKQKALPKIDGKKVGAYVGPVPPDPQPEKPPTPVDQGPKGLAEVGQPRIVFFQPPPRTTTFLWEFSKDKKKSFKVGEVVPEGGKFRVVEVTPIVEGGIAKYRFVYEILQEGVDPPKRAEHVFDLSAKLKGASPIKPLEPAGAAASTGAKPTAGTAAPPPRVAPGDPVPVTSLQPVLVKEGNTTRVEFDRNTYDYFDQNRVEQILESIKTEQAVDEAGRPRGIKITGGVTPGSVPEKFEIKTGDILISIGGHVVHDRNQIADVIKNKIPKNATNVAVVIERSARQITYNVDPRDPDIRGAGRLRTR